MQQLADWLSSRGRLTPIKTAIVEIATNKRYTYQELEQRVNQLSNDIALKGVGKGDRVALLSPNSAMYLELMFACAKLGAIFVPLNYRFSTAELAWVLQDCEPSLLVYHEQFVEQATQLTSTLTIPWVMNRDEYEQAILLSPPWTKSGVAKMQDPWAIIYTGGTTGKPKGVILTHEAITWNAVNTLVSWGLTEQEVTPVYIPMFHTGGLNALTTPVLLAGGTVVIGQEFQPDAFTEVLQQERCTIVLLVPTMYHVWIQSEAFKNTKFPDMHTFLSGGAPCPHSIYEAFQDKGITFKEGYGLTEAGPNNFYMDPQALPQKRGSVGRPMFFNSVRIISANGEDAGDEETGEIWISGPHLFSGYWKNPTATAEALQEGWLRTVDLGRRDAEGYHYIVGRMKDLILTGGENVYPLEVELVLEAHPDIQEVAVVGVPHEKWGEAVTAFVVLNPGVHTSEDVLRAYCRDKLASYKIPKQILFLSELPKTAVGKIDKKELSTGYRKTGS